MNVSYYVYLYPCVYIQDISLLWQSELIELNLTEIVFLLQLYL